MVIGSHCWLNLNYSCDDTTDNEENRLVLFTVDLLSVYTMLKLWRFIVDVLLNRKNCANTVRFFNWINSRSLSLGGRQKPCRPSCDR